MAGGDEKVKQVAEDLKGKKAKIKAVETKPEGTQEKPLPREVKAALEEAFGANLSKVRVHTGGNVPEIAKELKAKAFTIGNDIYFAKPGDAKDAEMLAHELAHVIQQGNGKMPKEKDGKALTSK
ncbi:MAG TPA: DUF4157 domain-containing protein [Paracoccaceae bacterium]|nr:DUF4157 domain-containing protein [Paracoccaceae bacterium]